jgi:hypothetical protein
MGEPAVGLIPFMNARLDEDEAGAWSVHDVVKCDAILYEDLPNVGDCDIHCDCGYPARVLREVAAKRARIALMIEAMEEMDNLIADDDAERADQHVAIGRYRAATVAVKHDATVYSDHPDYREKWAPSPDDAVKMRRA